MVFIIGSGLEKDEIPSFIECELMDKKGAPMVLRLQNKATAIFVAENAKAELLNSPLLSKAVKSTFIYFKNDTELLNMLNSSETDEVEAKSEVHQEVTQSDEKVEPVVAKQEPVNIEPVKPIAEVRPTEERPISTVKKLPEDAIQEVPDDTSLLGFDYTVPEVGYNDTDSMAERLAAKELQLSQFKAMFEEKMSEFENILKEHDLATATLQKMYDEKLNEASIAFNKLKADNVQLQITTGKYHIYAQKMRALLSEGFTPSDKEVILNLGMNVKVMATSGDIANTMLMFKYNIETVNMGYTIIDLSGTSFFQTTKMVKNNLAMGLFQNLTDEDVAEFKANLDVVNGNHIISSSSYHDVALLESDWVTFFTNVKRVCGDSKIMIILGDISSFSVLYTLSKLATVSKAYLHIRCSILGLQFAYNRLAFVPSIRGVRWVATHYFEKVAPIVQDIGKHYAIKTSIDNMLISEIEDM